MCGIFAFINNVKFKMDSDCLFMETDSLLIQQYYENFLKLKHRGPDFTTFNIFDNILIGFHRLAIMDLSFLSNQPYILKENNKTIIFICNGEIYNYNDLIIDYNLNITTKSDCLTIPKLYLTFDYETFIKLFTHRIKGEFSFILLELIDNKLENIIVGRDSIGIRPLYYHPLNNSKNLIFASEIKGMSFFENNIEEFPPGFIKKYKLNKNEKDETKSIFQEISSFCFNNIYVKNYSVLENNQLISDRFYLENIKLSVYNSIKRRLDSDKPIVFLLSGGVDSSLVASISSRLLNKQIKTFCCGMKNGSDLKYAKKVADFIQSEHHEVIFDEEYALSLIDDIIYTTETWDTTTIRASIGQYIVCSYISKNTDAKVVLVGEGPDEVCSSYLFNYYAPNDNELDKCAKEYVEKIHYFDVKRVDRNISKWSLEARVPLLDPEFINSYWYIPSNLRNPKTKGIEKWWLRKAFESENLLPEEVLWRKKEAFSDGVSNIEKSWFQIIQEYIENKYNMKEEEYYKERFMYYFGENRLNIIPHYWQPKWDKNGNEITKYIDPSARVLDIYKSSYTL